MARLSIYVSDEMKSRMDELDVSVNWSSVAQDAFEHEVSKRAWRKGEDMSVAVLERLRASKAEHEKEEAEGGYEDGVEWAKESASYAQLLKLSKLDFSDWWDSSRQEDGRFWKWIDESLGVEEPDSVFESFADHGKPPSDDYVTAFCEGAVEVWNEIAPQL